MSAEKPFVKLHKNTKGDIIFEFNPHTFTITSLIRIVLTLLLKIFLPLFALIDFLASKKKLVISSVGLGIGLGLSVLVTQHPDTLQAFPTLNEAEKQSIYVQQIRIPSIDLFTPVERGNVQDVLENVSIHSLVHDERSAELGGSYPVVVAEVGLDAILKNLEQVQIGDNIVVQGSNEAEYHFTVTEIRDMKAEYLPNVVGVNTNALILYKSKNALRTQLFMVIAKQS